MNSKHLLILLNLLISFSVFSDETHVIKKGETLYRLAKQYNTTVDKIIELNNITDITTITVGTEIIVSKSENIEETYKVAKGDTLFSISRKFNISLSQLREYNNLNDGDIISLGQVLKVSTDSVTPEKNKPDNVKKQSYLARNYSTPYWPLKGEIKKYSGRIQGVEIKGEPGDYIKAVSTGKVIWYDSYKGIGKVVLIEGENGYDYLYGTKENLNVEMGLNINAGDRIGRLKGNNTSIIFSVFKNGKPLNDISKAPR